MTPKVSQSDSALRWIGGGEGGGVKQHATSTADVLAAAIQALKDRGISNPDQFAALEPDAILGCCRWFDAQNETRSIGTGVLVAELRAGGKPGWHPARSVTERERDYGHQIKDWLNQHFPEFRQESGNPHPAAIPAVIKLHYRDGKRSLTRAKHGGEIRRAVREFDEKWLAPIEERAA